MAQKKQSLKSLKGDFMQERYGVRTLQALRKKLVAECHPHIRNEKRQLRAGGYGHDQQPVDDRDKANARAAVYLAIKRGILKKQPCAVCGAVIVEAHHRDYMRPLEVEWLCPRDHAHRHGKKKEYPNA